jgi:transposase
MDEPTCAGCHQRDAIIEQLRARIATLEQLAATLQQRVAELEARLKTNSSNSSLPPSANPPSAPKPPPKPPTGRKPGGQPGHPGHTRLRLPADQIISHVPTHCERCHAVLAGGPGSEDPPANWHQVVELPTKLLDVTEHQGQGRACPACGHVTWGPIPPEVLAHGFGPNLTALIGYLSGRCHLSKRDTAELLGEVLGVPLATGSVINAEAEMAAALEPPYAQAERAVQQAAVKNADETGWSQAGTLCWLWMAVAGTVALFKIVTGRGHAALRSLLGPSIRGVVSSDRWTAYGIIDLFCRQVCWAHLKRDFQKWVDFGGPAARIGQAGLEAVAKVFAAWRDFRQGVVDRPGLAAALGPVVDDLHAVLESGLCCPNKKAVRFCRNVLTVYPALWTFARVEGVEPTNNLAERTLRLAVIWRKISFGNHSQSGCRFTERILTAVQTLRLQNRPVYGYLCDTIARTRTGQPAPALVPAGA